MTDTDPIVTGGDLADLRHMRVFYQSSPTKAPLLDRLIVAAEADLPPLPEGWVTYRSDEGAHRVVWHSHGAFWLWDDARSVVGSIGPHDRDRLTPLRPVVTDEQVRTARDAVGERSGFWLTEETVRAAFKAAGIEVQS